VGRTCDEKVGIGSVEADGENWPEKSLLRINQLLTTCTGDHPTNELSVSVVSVSGYFGVAAGFGGFVILLLAGFLAGVEPCFVRLCVAVLALSVLLGTDTSLSSY